MHPDLSPHLHSAECNLAIKALLACHADNKFGKFFGTCNEVNEELNRCLRKEREENRSKNREKGKAMRAKVFDNLKEGQNN